MRAACIGAMAGVVTSIGLLGCASTQGYSADVVTSSEQAAMSPQMVIADLKAGNARFVSGNSTKQDWIAQAEATASGQFPKAIVLSCLDSRVPVEVVFDQGIGDVFVGRVAGNFENTDMLGSMEFGTKLAGAKAIVVLGHSACGAVKGAMANAELGNLTATLSNIKPAIATVGRSAGVTPDANNTAHVDAVVEANVRQTVRDITDQSPVLASLVSEGKLVVVGAVYDLATGRVTWLDS